MKNDKKAELKIDEEISRRTHDGYMHVYHITGISRKISGVTIVSLSRFDYGELLKFICDESYRLDKKIGDVFPSDMKKSLMVYQSYVLNTPELIGFSICDYRDQYNHQEGRTRAKRNWLRLQSKVKLF